MCCNIFKGSRVGGRSYDTNVVRAECILHYVDMHKQTDYVTATKPPVLCRLLHLYTQRVEIISPKNLGNSSGVPWFPWILPIISYNYVEILRYCRGKYFVQLVIREHVPKIDCWDSRSLQDSCGKKNICSCRIIILKTYKLKKDLHNYVSELFED